MKKKNTLVAGLAVTLLLGASSFAYFTDRAESTFTGKAGTVTLENLVDVNVSQNMAPGDVEDFSIQTQYTGSLNAKVRVRLLQDEDVEGVNKLAAADETEGFAILNGDKIVTIGEEGSIIDLGLHTPDKNIDVPLKVKLLEESGNSYQSAEVKLNYVVEALQQDHTGDDWGMVDEGEIVIHKATE